MRTAALRCKVSYTVSGENVLSRTGARSMNISADHSSRRRIRKPEFCRLSVSSARSRASSPLSASIFLVAAAILAAVCLVSAAACLRAWAAATATVAWALFCSRTSARQIW